MSRYSTDVKSVWFVVIRVASADEVIMRGLFACPDNGAGEKSPSGPFIPQWGTVGWAGSAETYVTRTCTDCDYSRPGQWALLMHTMRYRLMGTTRPYYVVPHGRIATRLACRSQGS